MRISILGKGGSGKSTISAGIILHATDKYQNILGIDADVNEHLADLIGLSKPEETIGHNFSYIFDYLLKNRADYAQIPRLGCIPPSYDSRFIFINERDVLINKFTSKKDNIRLAMAGKYIPEEVGITCFHGQLYPTELFLHYLIDKKDELVVVDSNAGIDSVSTSLYMTSDIYLFVVEPTLKSINVFKDYASIVSEVGQELYVVGNKINDDEDKEFIRKHVPESQILGFIPRTSIFKRAEQDKRSLVTKFVAENSKVFSEIDKRIHNYKRDYKNYQALLNKHFTNRMSGRLRDRYHVSTQEFTDNGFQYSKIIELTEDTYFDTCYLNSISNYRKQGLKFLANHLKGDVLELGAGKMPWFWALAYIKNVDSVVFTEYSHSLLDKYEEFISSAEPDELGAIHSETLAYLRQEGIIDDSTMDELLGEVFKKSRTQQYNFLEKPSSSESYDCIFGMEAIEQINTEAEFLTVFQHIYQMLKPNGTLVGTTFPYTYVNKKVNELIRLHLEGNYNPGVKEIEDAAKSVGFSSIEIHTLEHNKSEGPYKQAIFFKIVK